MTVTMTVAYTVEVEDEDTTFDDIRDDWTWYLDEGEREARLVDVDYCQKVGPQGPIFLPTQTYSY